MEVKKNDNMNIKTNLKSLFIVAMTLFVSCVDTTYDDIEEIAPTPLPEDYATHSIAELKALHQSGDNAITAIPEGTRIKGQVISSDKEGNIYKELYIQDETGGILIRLDSSPLYTVFSIGTEVGVVCDGLVLGSYGSNVQLGIESIYNGSPAAGRIPTPLVNEVMEVGIAQDVEAMTATVRQIRADLDYYVGRWVKIENIQVTDSDEGKTYADARNETTQNRNFNDGSTSSNIILRSSGYSDFAGERIPSGKGTMYAIVSRFRSDAQLYINDPKTDMVGFDGSSSGGGNGDGSGVTPPLVSSVDEAFNGTKYDDIAIEGWNNINEVGDRLWFLNEFQGNSYANMTVFRSGEERVVWLITPLLDVESAEDKTISFKSREEFMDSATFKVMVSSNYDGQLSPSDESYDWVELEDLNLSNDGDSGYGTWTDSGAIDLSSYGNVVVAFFYSGEDGVNDGGFSIDDFKFNAGNGESNSGDATDIDTYYNSVENQSGYALKTALHNIIASDTEVLAYSSSTETDVWDAFTTSDDKYGQNEIVWDMYSDIPNPNAPNTPDGGQPNEYEYTLVQDQCGNYSGEGSCYNREHSFPKSYFDDAYPMFSDVHHLVPSDGAVNGQRGNHPFGEVGSADWTSINGSKRGEAASGLGYNGTVFEPIDTYKGDFARIYFYMATRYEDVIGSWENNSSNADAVLDGSSDKVYEDWYLELMIQWHNDDPVSQKELDRNNAIAAIQNNRNPFIDHPEWVAEIWAN